MTILELHRGDDETIDLTVVDGGEPVDLTTAEALAFMVKRHAGDDDEDALISKTIGNGITMTAPETGEATVAIAHADTTDLAPGRYPWELQLIDQDGKVRTLAGGYLRLAADLIRAPDAS